MDIPCNQNAAIVIVAWNSRNDVVECLESLRKVTWPFFDVILVDNNSEDNLLNSIRNWSCICQSRSRNQERGNQFGEQYELIVTRETYQSETETKEVVESATWAERPRPRLIIVHSDTNLGFSGGSNLGMKTAQRYLHPKYILLLNSDTLAKEDFLGHLINHMEDNADVGICGPIQYEYPRTSIVLGAGLEFGIDGVSRHIASGLEGINEGIPFEVTYVSGAAMLLRCRMLDDIGLLDEPMFFGAEDLDISLRTWISGSRVMIVPRSIIFHKHHASMSARPTEWVVYYGVRSIIRSILKDLELRNVALYLTGMLFTQLLYSPYDIARRRSPRVVLSRLRAIEWNLVHWRETWSLRESVQLRRKFPDSRFIKLKGWKESLRFQHNDKHRSP